MEIKDFESVFKDREPKPYGIYSFFSVLVPLVVKDGRVHILFEIRADKLKRQPGEVCFPGGRLERDESPRDCAIRETCEELNISKESIKIINEMDCIYTYSNFTLYSFLGIIDYEDIKEQKVNQDEVKEIFLVPFDFFMENDPIVKVLEVSPDVGEDFPYHLINVKNTYNWRKGRSTIPIYRFQDHVIWGLTGKIIDNMVKIIKCSGNDTEKICNSERVGG